MLASGTLFASRFGETADCSPRGWDASAWNMDSNGTMLVRPTRCVYIFLGAFRNALARSQLERGVCPHNAPKRTLLRANHIDRSWEMN
jgi:hypothetical protein